MTPGTPQRPHHHLFSVQHAAYLDTPLRRFLYRPDRLAERYVNYGSRVLDFGCGPGFFSREFARRVGEIGQVWCVDLQEEMLEILRSKMAAEELLARVRTHQCRPDTISLPPELHGTFDTAFAIFVVHEVPDPGRLFREIALLLKPGGRLFYTEPLLEVSGKEFRESLEITAGAGFLQTERFFYFVNRAVVLKKA